MSLDGFIAGPDDDMRWVFGIDDGGGGTGEEVVRSISALLVGRRTARATGRRRLWQTFYVEIDPLGVSASDRPARIDTQQTLGDSPSSAAA